MEVVDWGVIRYQEAIQKMQVTHQRACEENKDILVLCEHPIHKRFFMIKKNAGFYIQNRKLLSKSLRPQSSYERSLKTLRLYAKSGEEFLFC